MYSSIYFERMSHYGKKFTRYDFIYFSPLWPRISTYHDYSRPNFFPYQVNGSLIKDNGTVIGSALIGQEFTSPKFLHDRPSPHHYSSYLFSTDPKQILPITGGSNYSNNNPYLLQRVNTNRKTFSKENDIPYQKVPVDILTASGSGLDSHITKQSADMQINRIAQHSGLTKHLSLIHI